MTREHSHSSNSDVVRAFKTRLAALRRMRFTPSRRSHGVAGDLRELLRMLGDDVEARVGVELMVVFFRADNAIYQCCDDSSGFLAPVFGNEGRERFFFFATGCEDKVWLADVMFDLVIEDEWGSRTELLQGSSAYLPEAMLRALADRAWNAAALIPLKGSAYEDRTQRHALVVVEMIARELVDAPLFERARRAHDPKLGTASCIHIAEVWLAAGDAPTALGWLERIAPNEHFMARERDVVLRAVYEKLGRREDVEALAWRRFRAARSVHTLDELLAVIGAGKREAVMAEAVVDIARSARFNDADALFLLACGRIDNAGDYVIKRRDEIDGDYWSGLLALIKEFEAAERALPATILYRALLDSILARAKSTLYGHAVRYLWRLSQLAPGIDDWKGVPSHAEYFAELKQKHRLKSSFWKRVADATLGKPEGSSRGTH